VFMRDVKRLFVPFFGLNLRPISGSTQVLADDSLSVTSGALCGLWVSYLRR
jgi:hypothetical protein